MLTSAILNPTVTPTTAPVKMHIFESAGLGKAPYTFIGIEKRTYQACYGAPVQPGSSCMFCSTGIVYLFWLRSADGKKFFVGSDCIMKSGDAGLKSVIDPHVKAHEREMRQERENYYISEFAKFVTANNYWTRPELVNAPHPNGYYASIGRTLSDYQKYCYEHAGLTARARMARKIMIAEGIMKSHDRCAKRCTVEVLAGIVPEGSIIVRKTLFCIIPESDDPTIFEVN